MGSRSSPPPPQTVARQEPPAFALPGLEFAAGEAQRQFDIGGPSFFPDSTVVPFAPQTETALGLAEQRALAGSPLTSAAQQQNLATIQGGPLNPFLAGATQAAAAPIFERFQEETLPGLRSAFASIGRSGSGAENRALQQAVRGFGRGVGEQGARLAFTSAENQALRQQQAIRQAPGLAEIDFTNIGRLADVGATREGMAAQQLQERIARHNFAQNINAERLNRLINQLQGTVGGSGTVTTTGPTVQQPNRFLTGTGGFLGGAATGAQLGSIIPGIGTGIGAGLGGTIGLLGGIL